MKIIVIDDSEDDLVLTEAALRKAEAARAIECLNGGEAAIDYFSGLADVDSFNADCPHLVLLDLKMPGVNGFDVLQWIRRHPRFKTLVVLVLSSSGVEKDVSQAYELGANAYLVKPTEFAELMQIALHIKNFWHPANHIVRFASHLPATSPCRVSSPVAAIHV